MPEETGDGKVSEQQPHSLGRWPGRRIRIATGPLLVRERVFVQFGKLKFPANMSKHRLNAR